MTLENFNKPENAQAYAEGIGSDEWPYGDLWRMALINPVIFGLAKVVQSGFDAKTPPSLYADLAAQREKTMDRRVSAERLKRTLIEWHENPSFELFTGAGSNSPTKNSGNTEPSAALADVAILDLGCGEGYRGRWLTRFGARYVGVDGSEPLIGLAETRMANATHDPSGNKKTSSPRRSKTKKAQTSSNVSYVHADLCNFDFDALDIRPNLVTAVILFDHISDPSQLISNLAMFLTSRNLYVPTLVISLHPRHFGNVGLEFATSPSNSPASDSATATHLGISERAVIESAQPQNGKLEVDVFYRTLRQWENLFTESGFHMLNAAPLHFSDRIIPEDLKESSVHFESHPFTAWLLFPKLRGRAVVRGDLEEMFAASNSILSDIRQPTQKTFLARADECSVLDLHDGQRVLYPGDLGGDVYFLLSGTVRLVSEEGVVKQILPTGELFGELETSEHLESTGERLQETKKYLIRRYIYAGDAGGDDVRILKIPGELFQMLLEDEEKKSTGLRLFRNLRDNFLRNSWTYFQEKEIHDEDATRFQNKYPALRNMKLRPDRLSRTAKAIMKAATLEVWEHDRPTDGSVLFISPEQLAQLVGDSDWRAQTVAHLNFFATLGVIKRIRLDSLDPWLIEYIEAFWDRLRYRSFESLVFEPLGMSSTKIDVGAFYRSLDKDGLDWNNEMFHLAKLKGGETDRGNVVKMAYTTKTKLVVSAKTARCYKNLCLRLDRTPEGDGAARRWLANLGYVNSFFVKKGYGSIIRVVDPHLLRRLAFEPCVVHNELLSHRMKAFPECYRKIRSTIDVESDLAELRFRRYLEIAEGFFTAAWKDGSDCDMSGASIGAPYLRESDDWRPIGDFYRELETVV